MESIKINGILINYEIKEYISRHGDASFNDSYLSCEICVNGKKKTVWKFNYKPLNKALEFIAESAMRL